MPRRKIPFDSRVILALAAWLVPSWQRPAWRDQWRSKCEAWWFFNSDLPGARLGLAGEALAGLPDALWRRLDREEAPRRLHLALGSPLFIGAVLLSILGVIGSLSGVASGWATRPPRNSGVRIARSHSPARSVRFQRTAVSC